MIAYRGIVFRIRSISDIFVEKIITRVSLTLSFRKSCHLWDNVENYDTSGQSTDGNITLCMRTACWILKATNTYSEYETFAASMVARTRLNITLQKAHYLSRLCNSMSLCLCTSLWMLNIHKTVQFSSVKFTHLDYKFIFFFLKICRRILRTTVNSVWNKEFL